MLETIDVGLQGVDRYAVAAGPEAIAELRAVAGRMRGARILHLNATPYGGGVAEILRSEVPLLRDLGIAAEWRIIRGDHDFFSVTKNIHNGLQGAARPLTAPEQQEYLRHSRENAAQLDRDYDLIVVHDPQPLGLLHFSRHGACKWVWRCHIDTSAPNLEVWDFLRPYIDGYDAAVFTLGPFVPPELPVERTAIIPPAIDPESPKNIDLAPQVSRRVVQWIGIDPDRPLVSQISRFDPWKDPLGVIEAFRRIKGEVPECQLALVGSMAQDDPQGWEIYQIIQEAAQDDPSIHLFTNLTGVGNIEVNAFQRLSNVVIQKSIREGFGLVVSEALWKGTPVVAGRAGGIPLQMQGGAGGFLVETPEDCAERAIWLMANPEEGKAMAAPGKRLVRERFLLPRMMTDELRLCADLLNGRKDEGAAVHANGRASEERIDPVCGMFVDPRKSIKAEFEGTPYYFCSESCRRDFEATRADG
jgi:trehalose synthase